MKGSPPIIVIAGAAGMWLAGACPCWRRQYLGTERRNWVMTDWQSLAVMIVSDGVAVTS